MASNFDNDPDRPRAHDPEVLGPDDDFPFRNSHNSASSNSSFNQNRGLYYFSAYSPARNGCLYGIITLVLTLICLGQFGVLGAIGFLVFYGAGMAIGAVAGARRSFEGKAPNYLFWRILAWVISFILTAWFAGAFDK